MCPVTATKTSKCSKPAGEHCRLHNPAPAKQTFHTAEDVFKALKVNTVSSHVAKDNEVPTKLTANQVKFQDITETRTLPDNIPAKLEEHILQSKEALSHLTQEQQNALSGYTGFSAGICNQILLGRNYEYYDEAPLWKETEGPCDFANREDLVDYMETIDEILASRQKEQRILYRGIPIYESLHNQIGTSIGRNLQSNDTEGLVEGLKEYYKQGKVFNHPTYLSTSISPHAAAERTENSSETKRQYYEKEPEIKGIQFELKTNAGLDVTGAARRHYAREREVVLPRDTHFKVTNVYTKPISYNTVSGYDDLFAPEEQEKQNFTELAVVVQMVEVDAQGNEITHTNPHKPIPAIEDIVAK